MNNHEIYLATVTNVDTTYDTVVHVRLDHQEHTEHPVKIQVPSPMPTTDDGAVFMGIPRVGQRVIVMDLHGLGDQYIALSYLNYGSDYGQDGGDPTTLVKRSEGDIYFSTGGYLKPSFLMRANGNIVLHADTWSEISLDSATKRVELVGRNLMLKTPGVTDYREYLEMHPDTHENYTTNHQYVSRTKELSSTIADDMQRLEEDSHRVAAAVPGLDLSNEIYNDKVIQRTGYLVANGERTGHVYELRTQQSRAGDKKDTFVERKIGLQSAHTGETASILGDGGIKYPSGALYELRVKDKLGTSGTSPLTYSERLGRLDDDIIDGTTVESVKGELYSKRLLYDGDFDVDKGRGWSKSSEEAAKQVWAESYGLLEDKSLYRTHMDCVTDEEHVNLSEKVLCFPDNTEIYNRSFLCAKGEDNVVINNSIYCFNEMNGTVTSNTLLYERGASEWELYEGTNIETGHSWEFSHNWNDEDEQDTVYESHLPYTEGVLYKRALESSSQSLILAETVQNEQYQLHLTAPLEDETIDQSLLLTKESVKLSDGKNSHYLQFTEDGIKLSDGTNDNYIELNSNGITIYNNSTDVTNIMTFGSEGVKINDHFLATHEFVDFFNTYKSSLGLGNTGGPVPLHPSSMTTFVTEYSDSGTSSTYKTDNSPTG
jgi:hypothetical protein